MATKLKNTSRALRALPLKALAVVLICVLLVLTSWNITRFYYLEGKYGVDANGVGFSDVTFTNSKVFATEVNYFLVRARAMSGAFLSANAMNDGSAWARQEKVIRDMLENNKTRTENTYYTEEYTTNTAGETGPKSRTEIYYDSSIQYRGVDYSISGEKEEYEQNVEEVVAQAKQQFQEEYNMTRNYLNSIRSLQYVIYNRNTKTYYTNVAGGVNAENLQATVNGLRKNQWHVSFDQQGGFVLGPDNSYLHSVWSSDTNLNYNAYPNAPEEYGSNHAQVTTADPMEWLSIGGNLDSCDVYLALQDSPSSGDRFDAAWKAYNSDMGGGKYPATYIALCALMLLLLTVYLLSVAGLQRDTDEIALTWIDNLPFDLHTLLSGVLILIFGVIWSDHLRMMQYYTGAALVRERINNVLLLLAFLLPALEYGTSLVRHIRSKTMAQNLLFGKWLTHRRVRSARREEKLKERMLRKQYRPEPKAIMIGMTVFLGVVLLLNGFFAFMAYDGQDAEWIVAAFFIDAFVMLYLLYFFWSLQKLMRAVLHVRSGDFSYPLKRSHICPPLRGFADNVLSVQEGMRVAVDSAIRDQKMKTELITNVSHDLKTPLTSIISYVDLLKRCEIADETVQDYLRILDEKSNRMKVLVEDLVEASKASSGNVELHPVQVNLNELAMQSMGEHEDEFANAKLETKLQIPDQAVTVLADSQKTWRVVENLFHNARKYALPNTRVFISVFTQDNYGVLEMKNISRYPIDVPVEELTQRFVRGDVSRSGEGSGLGLSIAQSLCELQGGKFAVAVDGDMFKATMYLPLPVKERSKPETLTDWLPKTQEEKNEAATPKRKNYSYPSSTKPRQEWPFAASRQPGKDNLESYRAPITPSKPEKETPPTQNDLPWPPPEWKTRKHPLSKPTDEPKE